MTNNVIHLPCEVANLLVGEDQESLILPRPAGEVSDGNHSFDELYDHRNLLFLALLKVVKGGWYSERHNDGSSLDGWFISGIELSEGEQISYHLPNKFLEVASLNLKHLEFAPKWDGHKSSDVLSRLINWIEFNGDERKD